MSTMMNEQVQLVNGEVWQSPSGVRGMAQWIDDEYWVLLSEPRSCHGGTEMTALPNRAGRFWFGHAELYHWLLRNQWRRCDARIALQVA